MYFSKTESDMLYVCMYVWLNSRLAFKMIDFIL